jgi:hypothetical protein
MSEFREYETRIHGLEEVGVALDHLVLWRRVE